MVNATEFRSRCAVTLLALLVLTAAAWMRGAEYDEQYTLFLTAGVPRPDWPERVFPAGAIAVVQAGHAGLAGIVRDLRATDVHPPLYFWAVWVWRTVFGPGLFAARLLSVVCGVVSIWMVGIVALRCRVQPVLAMLLTLGCYGFVYTNSIARGFAPAEMLILAGVALLLGGRPLLAGACLGAACCCNYLALFIAVSVIAASGGWLAATTTLPFLVMDAWFFVAQHAARPGQFPPFEFWPSAWRLAEYQTAALFGGLPLYTDGVARVFVKACLGLLTVGVIVRMARCGLFSAGRAVRILLVATIGTPIGLMILGAVFDNTPIELRYLCFGLPFVALLIARSMPLNSSERVNDLWRKWVLPVVLSTQLVSIAGLLLSPRTMQPARAIATEAANLAGDGIVLLPRGNDGVGIVGAFGIEAPPSLPLLLVRPGDSFLPKIVDFRRAVVAAIAQDRDSVAAIATMRAAFATPNWRHVAIASNLDVYERTGQAE